MDAKYFYDLSMKNFNLEKRVNAVLAEIKIAADKGEFKCTVPMLKSPVIKELENRGFNINVHMSCTCDISWEHIK